MEQGAQRNDRYAEGVEGQDAVRSRRWGVGGGLALEPQPTRRSGERRGVWRRSGRKKPGHKRTWSIFILTEHFLDGINQYVHCVGLETVAKKTKWLEVKT